MTGRAAGAAVAVLGVLIAVLTSIGWVQVTATQDGPGDRDLVAHATVSGLGGAGFRTNWPDLIDTTAATDSVRYHDLGADWVGERATPIGATTLTFGIVLVIVGAVSAAGRLPRLAGALGVVVALAAVGAASYVTVRPGDAVLDTPSATMFAAAQVPAVVPLHHRDRPLVLDDATRARLRGLEQTAGTPAVGRHLSVTASPAGGLIGVLGASVAAVLLAGTVLASAVRAGRRVPISP
ncbi:hypothetical protein [Gordonia shandongensis]|uniref:hypothetical protein n=1 Tax=Gordonia shandongensis TaxID=376351 RepID=UPI0003FAA7A3|nr:hypothetical protein [Gordonia shandongensis]